MGTTYNLIASATVGAGGAATVSFSNISQNYRDLIVRASVRSTHSAATSLLVAWNNDTNPWFASVRAEGYSNASTFGGSTSTGFVGYVGGTNYASNYFATFEMYCPRYNDNLFGKTFAVKNANDNNVNSEWHVLGVTQRYYKTHPITSLVFTCASGNFAQHTTFYLYGVNQSDATAVPSAPTIGTATAVSSSVATVAFTPVTGAGSYTATSSPGGITATSANSPIVVSGLTNATSYTFTVRANNAYGGSAPSAASNSITTGSNTPIILGRQFAPYLLLSGDGLNWGTVDTSVPASIGRAISKIGSTYVVNVQGANTFNSGKTAMTSTDLINWTERLVTSSVTHTGIAINATDGNVVVATGAVGGFNSAPVTFSTTDGITWTQRNTGMSFNPYVIAYKNGYFIIGDGNGNYAFSTNGTTSWTQASAQWENGGVPNICEYYGGNWWFGGNGGSLRRSSTINPGSNWTSVTSSTTNQLRDMAVNGANAVISVNDSRIIFSNNNGSSWTTYTGIGTGFYNLAVIYASGPGLYIMTNSGNSIPVGPLTKIYTSSNGTTWTERTSPNIFMQDGYGRLNA